jgi:predicted extracellular nuclease
MLAGVEVIQGVVKSIKRELKGENPFILQQCG